MLILIVACSLRKSTFGQERKIHHTKTCLQNIMQSQLSLSLYTWKAPGLTKKCNFRRLKGVNKAKIDFPCLVISDSYRFVYARP